MIDDSQALLKEADRQLAEVRNLYESCLRHEAVSAELRTKIKNLIENQRSALEYVAHAIQSKFGTTGRHAYFPIAVSEQEFSRQFDRQLPGVGAANPELKGHIETLQPYHVGMEWLSDLADLTNENMHRRLTPQTRRETIELRGQEGGGTFGRRGGPNIQLGEGASISFGGSGPMYATGIQRTVYVDWIFEHVGKSAIATLETISAQLPGVLESVCRKAEL